MNNREKGFSFIEGLIVLCIIGILLTVGIAGWENYKNPNQETYSTSQGTVIVKCIAGYKHTVSKYNTTQVINHEGKGISCE